MWLVLLFLFIYIFIKSVDHDELLSLKTIVLPNSSNVYIPLEARGTILMGLGTIKLVSYHYIRTSRVFFFKEGNSILALIINLKEGF